jgi:glycosyltransferase involved in cell wall biosynthesis
MHPMLRRLANSLLTALPPVRRVFAQRDQALRRVRELQDAAGRWPLEMESRIYDLMAGYALSDPARDALAVAGAFAIDRDARLSELGLPEAAWKRIAAKIQRVADAAGALPDSASRNAYVDAAALSYFLRILTHSGLPAAPRDTIEAIVRPVFLLLISNGHPGSYLIARAYALLLRRCMEQGADADLLVQIYDCAYGMYWVGAASLVEMAGFDTDVVKPFAEHLRSRLASIGTRPRRQRRPGPLRVAYLCHYAHLTPGNAVSPIVASLARLHSRLAASRHRVFVFCPMHFQAGFKQAFAGSEVAVRHFPEGHTPSVDEVRSLLAEEDPDVVITDIGSGVATCLFEERAGRLQLWLEMGYPYWSVGNLDWVFLGHKVWRPDFGVPSGRWSTIVYRHAMDTIVHAQDPAELAAARARIPAGAPVLGWFGRFPKATLEYLRAVEEILRRCPDVWFVLGGVGDPGLIRGFIARSGFGERFVFIERFVSVRTYAGFLTAFVDTFPFSGGNVCRELALFGVPVVSLVTHDYPVMIKAARDPELVADSVEQFVELARRLVADPDFRAARRAGLEKLRRDAADPKTAARQIVDRIDTLWAEQSAAGIAS